MTLAIAAVGWAGPSRLVHHRAERWRASERAWSARAAGAGPVRTLTRHLLPGIADLFLAASPLLFAQAVLVEATLSFLGVGGGSEDSWGRLIAEASRTLPAGWWQVAAPGALLLLLTTVLWEVGPRHPARWEITKADSRGNSAAPAD
ncbi:MAG: ABC transporter permease subunit [Acidobacteriota bacterium]|nr:ABC transporter permease subunit [Acidobacteriota bacterium]